jgi:nitroreductase
MTTTSKELSASLRARYGHIPDVLDALNPTIETMLQHRSVRAYTAQPLPANTAELLVAAAQSASTSSNMQTWSVIAVTDPGRKDRLAKIANNQEFVRTCPLFLVWVTDLARLKALGNDRQKPHESLNYLEMLLVGAIDSALASQNAAVAAESMNLGMVYIGAIRNDPAAVAKELNLPPMSFATFGMCIGYAEPSLTTAAKPRLPQSAILHKNTYDTQAYKAGVESYNQTMDTFYAEQKMTPLGPWDLHTLNRVRGPEAMGGRHTLMETLRSMGFEIR